MSMNVPIISGKDSKNYSYHYYYYCYYHHYYYYYHYHYHYRQIIVMNTAMELTLC